MSPPSPLPPPTHIGRPSRKAKGKSALGRGSSGRRSRHSCASHLRPQSPPPGSGLASLPLEEQLLSARPSSPLPGASPRVWAHPGLIPSRRPRGPEVKELPGDGAGTEPGCARTCALTVRPCGSQSYPAGAARGEGTGSDSPRQGSCARRSGRERDLTGRGQRGAGGAEPKAENAAREPSGQECTRGPDGAVQR